jgi:UDP-2,4-diacetamido-2,4,6-trideoxy-beta-L-altropyranose hydrolase
MTEILFRADGGVQVGNGHLTRCLALAQGMRNNMGIALLTADPHWPAATAWRDDDCRVFPLKSEPGSDADGHETAALAQELGCSWIIADSYAFGTAFQRSVRAAGTHLLLIDDIADRDCDADAVLNQNPGAEIRYRDHYVAPALLGTHYALLRRSVLETKPAACDRGEILISFGGADIANVGHSVLQALSSLPWQGKATLVCTAGQAGQAEAERTAERDARLAVRSGGAIESLMAQADIAITAGGTTTLELAYLGVPMVLLPVAKNQQPGAAALAAAGAATLVGDPAAAAAAALALLPDADRRRAMARCGRAMVDGQGAKRVMAFLTKEMARQ